jgi:tight adherence protein C
MSAAVGFLVLISALGILYAILYRGVDAARISHDLQQPRREWRDYLRRGETVIKSVGESIPRPADELPRQALRLVQAGIRRKDGAVLFLGVQVLVALSLMLTVMVTGYPRINMLVAVLGSILVGVLIPDVWLKHTTEKRKERIRLALPDGIDLTVVCVEAGLGLDQALLRIAQELRIAHPDLSDELELMTLEVGAGRSRPEALRNLAKRTAVDDVSALAAMLIQTYRFGTSVGQSLRIYSENLRTKRRQRAEERAAKITVKMMIPMVLFIFPAILIVVGGPAMIQISEKLLPFLAGR